MKQVKISARVAQRAVRRLAPMLDIEEVFIEVEFPAGGGELRVALDAGAAEVPVLVSALESSGLALEGVVEVPRPEFEDTVWVIPNAVAGKGL